MLSSPAKKEKDAGRNKEKRGDREKGSYGRQVRGLPRRTQFREKNSKKNIVA